MGQIDLGKYKAVMTAIALFLTFVLGVFAVNFYMAERLTSDASGVNLAGQQSMQAERIMKNLMLMEARLVDGEPIEQPYAELKSSILSFDSIQNGMMNGGLATGPKGNSVFLRPISSFEGQALLQSSQQIWKEFGERLDPIVEFDGKVYSTNPNEFYTREGAELSGQLEEAIAYGRRHTPRVLDLMGNLSQQLEDEATARVGELRSVQAGGMGVALVLFFIIVFYFGRKLKNEERAAARARLETESILRTVNEGLFLLDKELKIGLTHSNAMGKIFRRQKCAGLKFERLLKEIVPEKTLRTAIDYVELLWSDRVNEKLVKTLNPLSEIEVHFEDTTGGFETHYLEFDFNRVKTAGNEIQVLVTVSDITQRVLLAMELEESQQNSKAQLDLLLGILHIEPSQLLAFLEESDASMKMVNATLREPARDEDAFRSKLDNIFRQVHSVKGEAATLGLGTVESQAHDFEDMLNELRDKDSLTGNDFLPLAVQLDNLFGHLESVRDVVSRLAELRMAIKKAPDMPEAPAPAASTGPVPLDSTGSVTLGESAGGVAGALHRLAERIATDHGKQVKVECLGLDDRFVPDRYRKPVKDMAVQLLRNAIIHGIEDPATRQSRSKSPVGTLTAEFGETNDGFEFVFRDDGQGLIAEQIKASAVQKGLLSESEAAAMPDNQALSLIFKPGFSTASSVSQDAGRGVGLDLVRHRIKELGGKLRLSSAPGKRTEFRVVLPAAAAAAEVA